MTAEQVYTVEEAAKALKVNPETVKRMLRTGKLGAIKIGRLWRIRESDLQTFLSGDSKLSDSMAAIAQTILEKQGKE